MGVRFDGRRATGVEYRTWRGEQRTVTAGEVILCGGAFNSPQLLQVSGVGDRRPSAHRRGPGRPRPTRRRRQPAGPPRGLRPARGEPAGVAQPAARLAPAAVDRAAVDLPQRPGDDEPFRGRRVRAQQRRRRLPQPDVPLPADRRALRRLAAARTATATRCTSVRCTRTFAARCASRRRTPGSSRHCASTICRHPNDRREWVEAIHVARHILGQPAFAPFDAGEVSPGPASSPTRRSSTGSPTTPRPRFIRRARARWAPASSRWSIRTRCASTASTGCASSTPR